MTRQRAALAGLLLLAAATVWLEHRFGALSSAWLWLQVEAITQQRVLHRQLAAALHLATEQPVTASAWLAWLSFLYGVFHAVGPGHGKLVVTTYLATRPTRLLPSLLLTASASLLQGLVAIVAVHVALWSLGWTFRDTGTLVSTLTAVSFALVVAVGLYLTVQGLRQLQRSLRPMLVAPAVPPGAGAGADHDHDHAPGCPGHAVAAPSGASVREMAGIVLSIGLRPCSGAILVLALAHGLDLVWGGILAVAAMSVGTALAIGALALITVHARAAAQRLFADSPDRPRRTAWIGAALRLLGGMAVTIVGAALLAGALSAPRHPLL